MKTREQTEELTWELGESGLFSREAGETALITRERSDGESTATRELQPTPRWVLAVCAGPEEGRRIELGGGRVSLGRGARCEVRLEDPSISRLHLWVEPRPEGVLLHEESTKNGTTLDGEPCLEGLAGEGQRIALGQTVLLVEREGGVEEKGPGGIVEQAMRVLGAGASAPRQPASEGSQPLTRRALLVLSAAVAVGGLALALLWPSAPEEVVEEESVGELQEARLAFDQGIEALRGGEEEGARAFFASAARWDPESEEPGRYLRWLDEEGVAAEPRVGSPLYSEALRLELPEEDALRPFEAELDEGEEEVVEVEVEVEELEAAPAPRPVRRQARLRSKRAAEQREAAQREIQALLEKAEGEEGIAEVESLRQAWERARSLRGGASLHGEIGQRLASAAFAVGEDALRLGRLGRAVSHFKLSLQAEPSHAPASAQLASLEARAESFLVEGYALLERDPTRARAWLELVIALTSPQDPLHQRARKWLHTSRR